MPNLFSQIFDGLASHLIALSFLGFLAVAVVARGPLFGMESSGPEVSAQQSEAPELAESATQATEPKVVTPESEVVEVVSVAQPGAEVARQQQPATAAETAESVFRPTQPVSSDHKQFVPLDVVKEAKRAELGTAFSARKAEQAEHEQLLQNARSAFWDGALEQAETLYLRYLKANPSDATGFGELGNVYQSMGRPQDALDAYFEAGVRFRIQGDREQLSLILAVLNEAGDPRAGELR